MNDIVIEAKGLTKRYGRVPAVDDISFTVGRGEIFGLLGLFMTASGTCDSKWHEYTVQQWLKAGAFYLAMVGLTCPRSS